MIFYSGASMTFRVDVDDADIRNNQVRMVLSGAGYQEFFADVSTDGESGKAYLQCDFDLPSGKYAVQVDLIIDDKPYVLFRDTWQCVQSIAR